MYVENDVVKMEWETDLWLQTTSRGKRKPIFIMCAKNYETDNGTVSVNFCPETCFVFGDNIFEEGQDLWSAEDLIGTIKADMPGNFPYGLEQYVPLHNADSSLNVVTLEKLGLLPYKEDIEKRFQDILQYGEEVEVQF